MSELFSVSGKRVVITGGTSGIGLMMARAFVAGGAEVIVASRKAAVAWRRRWPSAGIRSMY